MPLHATDVIIYAFMFMAIYFQVFYFVILIDRRREFRTEREYNARAQKRANWPSATIIVPAFNEEKTIGKTIESLLALDYPKDRLTIMVINDGSKDRTSEIARSYAHDPRVNVHDKENGGKHSAMNLGIERSSSDLIGCLDADSFVDPKALKVIVPYFDRPQVMAVCPSVQIWKPETWLQKIQAAEYLIGALTKKIFTFLNAVYVTPGPFSIYRREVFERVGGFRHGYSTEDMEMALRMQAEHMVIETSPDALVYTVAPRTVPSLYRQRVRWVTGHLKNTTLTYRFMLFRARYGNLGMFTLPFALLSVVMALFFIGYAIVTFVTSMADRIEQWWVAGFHWHTPSFEWFFIGSDMKRVLIYYMFASTILIMLLASRLTTRRFQFTRGMFYFMVMYGFIAPLWLAKSLWNLAAGSETRWR